MHAEEESAISYSAQEDYVPCERPADSGSGPARSSRSDQFGVAFVLLDRAHDESYHVGHVWLEWHSDREGQRAFRGYYPDLSKIDADIRSTLENVGGWFRFFPTNALPGRFERDIHAQELRERGTQVYEKGWPIEDEERSRLERRCFIPPGRDHVPEGLYSWNETKPEEHNCSSWAVSVVNHTKGDEQFIGCTRPKRLKHVRQVVWGTES
jgi:hypothetical protein